MSPPRAEDEFRRYPAAEPLAASRRSTLVAFLAYLAFVVYGSLVPFEYRDHSLHQALQQFRDIAYLNLGVASRADWIANIVLYVPLAFLGCVWMLGMRRVSAFRRLGVILVFALCVGLAVAVEFTQIFFAPRTVSLNDLLAETLGTLGGIGLWIFGRRQIADLWDAFTRGGRQSLVAAAAAYGIIYVALSLFPYDFVLSGQELAWKLASGNQGWLIAAECGGWLRCSARLAGDAIAIAPLGVLLGLLAPTASYRRVFWAGALLGLPWNSCSCFSPRGSVKVCPCSCAAWGWWVESRSVMLLLHYGPRQVAELIRRAAPIVALPYLALLAALNGWFSGHWLPPAEALAGLADVRFMPFYYHYFSTEPAAMASALANAAMYAPVGIVFWARHLARLGTQRPSQWGAALSAFSLSVVLELGKLFVPPKHPDFTIPLVAIGAAIITYAIARFLERGVFAAELSTPTRYRGSSVTVESTVLAEAPAYATSARVPAEPQNVDRKTHGGLRCSRVAPLFPADAHFRLVPAAMIRRILSVTLMGVLAVLLWRYPIAKWELALALALYGVVLLRNPSAWLLVIPAVVPALDLVSHSGWLYWESPDFFLLLTLALSLWRYDQRPINRMRGKAGLLIALLVSYGISALHGLLPLPSLDANSFFGYFNGYNSLRVAKGFFWVVLLLPLLNRTLVDRAVLRNYLLPGVTIGFVGVISAVIWERQLFSGLFNFSSDFRVTGPFSTMHTGGSHIEAYLALVLPVLAAFALEQRRWSHYVLGVVLLASGVYGLLVTFARAGVLALGIASVVFVVGLGRAVAKYQSASRKKAVWVSALMIAIFATVSSPIMEGKYFSGRFSKIHRDLHTRVEHWRDVMQMMDPGLAVVVFGMGLGRFPQTYLLHHLQDDPLGIAYFETEQDNIFLRMVAGDSLYVEQFVSVHPNENYVLEVRLRSTEKRPRFNVPVCAKAMLYSYQCRWLGMDAIRADGNWHSYRVDFNSKDLGSGAWYSRRPVKLLLYDSGAAGSTVDVDDIRLVGTDGLNLVRNGDFERGTDFWFFSTDNHLPWHVKQLGLEIYFEQGLFGVFVFALFVSYVLYGLARRVRRGDVLATGLLAGLVGFLVVGCFGSLFDAPRLTFLFFLFAFTGILLPSEDANARREEGTAP